MGAPSKIDRLIELGLNRYGAGDLEGALLVWEEALAIDPNNAQANSYVDYVRLHYEMLSGDPEVSHDDAPFGIEEEPEYQIEVSASELQQAASQPALEDDPMDGGWFDDEVSGVENRPRLATTQSDAPEIVIEAELPDHVELGEPAHGEPAHAEPAHAEPAHVEIEAEPPPGRGSDADLSPEISFEDATREYYGGTSTAARRAESDFVDIGSSGGTAEHPPGYPGTVDFQQEYTGGFTSEGSSLGFSTQETGVRKRDLGFVQPLSPADPDSGPTVGAAPTMDSISLGTSERTFERAPHAGSHVDEAVDEDELLATLPNPRRPAVKPVEPSAPPAVQPSKAVTKDLPGADRRPAKRDSSELSQAEVMLNHAPTKDFGPPRIDITAPTRDLGLRNRPGSKSDIIDDEAPTKQSDVRAIRQAVAQNEAARDEEEELTRAAATHSDIALAFDPIDARAEEILAEVDAGAPANEPRDEQTRRRIAALIERAVAWLREGDPEKAVAAVDLAMSEDPNSALGQKLITRYRDSILSVFQGFIGDLERMPQLARPLHELRDAPISPRAAFLLSRIDGTLTIDELLDVSGMPRIEAYRYLCQLYLRGILR